MTISENLDKFLIYVNIPLILLSLGLFGAFLLDIFEFTTQNSAIILAIVPVIAITFAYAYKLKELKEVSNSESASRKVFYEWFAVSLLIIFIGLIFFTIPLPNTT